MSETKDHMLDNSGLSKAATLNGRVALELWLAERGPSGDPIRVWMKPAQAMELIQSLAWAAQRAIKDAVT